MPLFVESATAVPPEGAAALSVTVQVAYPFEVSVTGEQVKEESVAPDWGGAVRDTAAD